FYWLFSGSLVILFFLLGYGWYIMYRSENKRIQEDINKVVHDCADSLQNANFNKYDVIRTFTDREYSEKLAFAAGMTQNQNKIAMSWGDIDSSYTLPAAPENNN